ncbi:hypothetical protein [Mucilaginibacter sp.]|uniref:hypothetical protein n=1 Tax=Mucilaginibacter sp. TaxID=1882438 RepID=UPI0035BC58CE
MNDQNNQSTDPEGTIPVDTAIEMAKNWNIYLKSSNQKFNVKSYSVPIINFKNILKNNPDAEAVRAYIGLKDANDPSSSQLIMVPIVNGQEVLYIDTTEENVLGGDGQSNVYDVTTACPPTCPPPGTGLGD